MQWMTEYDLISWRPFVNKTISHLDKVIFYAFYRLGCLSSIVSFYLIKFWLTLLVNTEALHTLSPFDAPLLIDY